MILTKPVFATCPVCVVAVGSGLWLAEKLGVDDLIAAVWIGGFTTALAIVFASKGKKIRLPYPEVSWTFIFYLLTLATLFLQGKLTNPLCQIWGINKIFLGLTLGVVIFWLGVGVDRWLRRFREDKKAFFPFQKVVCPLGAIVLTSWLLHLVIC
ncbi:hypothetical protein J7J95_00810 [bacterium]|nr:hypothetical protein [bacterium]